MSDKEKLVQMLLRCSMSTGHADTMDDLIAETESQIIKLRQKNADLVEALTDLWAVSHWADNPYEMDAAKLAIAKATGGE